MRLRRAEKVVGGEGGAEERQGGAGQEAQVHLHPQQQAVDHSPSHKQVVV